MSRRIARVRVLLFAVVAVALSLGVPSLALARGGIPPVPPSGLTNTYGAQTTLAMMVTFQNLNFRQEVTPWDVRAAMAGASNVLYEMSYGKTWLTGILDAPFSVADVRGPYPLPIAATCDTAAIASWGKSVAYAAGVEWWKYRRLVFFFPTVAECPAGISTAEGSFVNGTLDVKVITHELGHNFGLTHSQALMCSVCLGGTQGCPLVTYSSQCLVTEYGDDADTMGNGRGHYNAFQKERLGWLNFNGTPPITTVTWAGFYWIEAYESASTGSPKALKILRSVSPIGGFKTFYYVEYRRPLGADSFLANPEYVGESGGVFVHVAAESEPVPYLLDMTPLTENPTFFHDASLSLGQSYTDADVGITIMPWFTSGNSIAVWVNFTTP